MSDFVLTADNYYSSEADKRFMSVHQYLDFVGHMGVYGCEARAMAKLNGEWEDETTTAMLVGSYVEHLKSLQKRILIVLPRLNRMD